MHVLRVTRTFPPDVGGIEAVAGGLTRALVPLGVTQDVVTLDRSLATGEVRPRHERHDGYEVHRIAFRGSSRYPLAAGVLRHVAGHDLVHIHAVDSFVDLLAATRWWHRTPLVLTTHGGIFHTERQAWLKERWFRTVTRASLRGVHTVICSSPHDHDLFAPIVDPRRLHVLGDGVDVARYLGLERTDEPGLVVGVGRIVENKHVDRLVDLLPHLRRSHPDARIVWIGADDEQRAAGLLARAESLGVAGAIEFTGRVADHELGDWLRRASCVAVPSGYEAFGVSTIEALASGAVVLATPVGIHPDAIDDGVSGFLWPAGDPAADAQHIARILDLSDPRRSEISDAARRASQRFGWPEVAAAHLDVYERAASEVS